MRGETGERGENKARGAGGCAAALALAGERAVVWLDRTGPVVWLAALALLGGAAVTDYEVTGLSRRTFEFYPAGGRVVERAVDAVTNPAGGVVEDRMIRRSGDPEEDLIRYVDEAVLGPESPDLLPLFPGGTRLVSLLYRDGVVYASFTEAALLPPEGAGAEAGVARGFRALDRGIRRNFPGVGDVRFFIGGRRIFVDGLYTAYADKE